MFHRLVSGAAVGLLLMSIVACEKSPGNGSRVAPGGNPTKNDGLHDTSVQVATAGKALDGPRHGADPIIIPQCRVTVIQTQDVPSQRDGVIWKILVKEGDKIVPDQVLAQLDDRLAHAECDIKHGKIIAAKADGEASIQTRDESLQRMKTAATLWKNKVIAEEQYRMEVLTYTRYREEAISKGEAVKLAELEEKQSKLVLDMHQIRSSVSGEVKTVFKKMGEAVKAYEPIFQIHSRDTVRIEGLVDAQYLDRIQRGMEVVIEPSYMEAPLIVMTGHFQDITGVAVTRDPNDPTKTNQLLVSASEDGTVRVWDVAHRHERMLLRHPAAVRAVACTGAGAPANLCLSGAADGKARLWNLSTAADPLELSGQGPHR